MKAMPPRIAIPVPHSGDAEYAERSLPQYEDAVRRAGGEPVRVPLNLAPADVTKIAESCDGVLLPGSRADVDPEKFQASRHPKTAEVDTKRDGVDQLLLDEAYKSRKPILGICYGLQSLNVYRKGTLIQDIDDFLPPEKKGINHEAGRKVEVAHTVEVEPGSLLAGIVENRNKKSRGVPVNSSHHQSAEKVGEGLRVVARCSEDGVIEALEGTAADHFVLAVQWHPERSEDSPSKAIFLALVEAARRRRAS
jgi:putative glutamine amidotransferase